MTEMLARPAPAKPGLVVTTIPLTRTDGKQTAAAKPTITAPAPVLGCSTLCPAECLSRHAGDMTKKGKTGKQGCKFCVVQNGRKRCMRLCSAKKRRKAWSQ